MKKKILIISRDGKIGSELFEKFKNNKSFIFTSYKDKKYYLNLKNVKTLSNFNKENIECVILLAGITDIKKCDKFYSKTFRINVTNSFKILQYFSKSKKIFISSNSVFDGNLKTARFYDKKKPLNNYGKQKSIIEDKIIKNLKNYCIVRSTKIYTNKLPLEDKIINKINKKEYFYAFDDIFLKPIFMSDFIKLLQTLIKKKYFRNSIFHLNGKYKITSYDFARQIFLKKNLNLKYLKKASGVNKIHQTNLLIRKLT
tara:strand:- start:100 stop:867 length:768 start_codon:yes stop_codon:yes gene_type:complete